MFMFIELLTQKVWFGHLASAQPGLAGPKS
jgi:hypothetical protein